MNNKFKDLALSCIVENIASPEWVFTTTELEKFAELIVQECLEISYNYDLPKMSGPGMIIAGRIEEHFGVEE